MLVRIALLLAISPLLSACAGSIAAERVDHAFEAPYTLGAGDRPSVGAFCPAGRIDPAVDAPYTLDAGDRLRVVVFGQDGLSNTYAVDGSGRITMPLIGPVEARGKTTSELASAIGTKLRAGYIREPHVAVEVENFRPFFILGEVTNAGQYAYVNGLTVQSAVAIAGGFSPRALK